MYGARRALARVAGFAFGLAVLLAFAAPVQALTVPFTFEFDDGVEGDFGSVRVEEDGSGGLFFEIALGEDLGPNADLHYFYFNLVPDIVDLAITSDDSVVTDYTLSEDPSVRGGAGSSFEYEVFFGNGAGPKGNGNLAFATFTILSESGISLTLDDLFELSSTSQDLESHFAAHVQSTSTRDDSETIGAIIPEPMTSALLAVGLLGLAAAGRRSA